MTHAARGAESARLVGRPNARAVFGRMSRALRLSGFGLGRVPGARARVPFVLVLVLAVSGVAACSSKSEQQLANDAVTAGLQAHYAGDLTTAEADYKEALKHDPTNEYAYYNLGVIYQTQGEPAMAEPDYRIAISIDPNFASALFNLAIIRAAASGGPAEAISLYEQVVKLTPDNAGAHFNLGLLLRVAGQTAEGDAQVAQGIAIDHTLSDPAKASPGASPAASGSTAPNTSAGASATP